MIAAYGLATYDSVAIDQVDAESTGAIQDIRRRVAALRILVATWTPAPCPEGWR